jgi:transcriptional regulator with XRE-family HTH domain
LSRGTKYVAILAAYGIFSENRRMTLMASTLGQRLRRARQREGLTQQALADKLGLIQTTISNWENGSPFKSVDRERIEGILGPLTNKKRLPSDPDQKAITVVENEISSFGSWVRENREKASLSVPELARKADISPASIYNIENGKIKNPQSSTRNQLAAAFNAKIPADVVEETEEEQNIQGLGSLRDFDPYDESQWPEGPGVYVLYDITERPVYVGKGRKISARLKEHEKQKFWIKPIVNYASYIEVKDETIRHQLEQVLIKFLKKNAVINIQSVEGFDTE